ncbi:MAG: flavin monoamine oxidase family protein [Pseudomonadota bacterium]
MTLRRRDVLRLGAGGLAMAPLLSACAGSGEVLDVAIIGAGVSGMTAGHALAKKGVKSFAVIEGRDRVGGRTFNQTVNGQPVESGTTWIGPGQTRMYELCEELGLEVFPSYWKGDYQFIVGGEPMRLTGKLPPAISDPALLARVESLARTVPLDAPFRAPDAARLDAQTFADYLKAHGMPAEELEVMNATAIQTFGARGDQISLLYVLFYIHSAGSYTALETMEGGAQQDRIKGGTQAVTLALQKRLGDHLRFNSPVKRIRNWDGAGPVVIESEDGRILARRVILALSPSQAGEIAFDPPLPKGRQAILDGWPRGGSALTMHFGYRTPFWRKQGLSGLGLEIFDGGSMLIADVSPEDGSSGILKAMGPVGSAEARKAQALAAFVKLFGPEAATPTEVVHQDWSRERFTRGCVSPMAPGFLSSLDTPLAAPCGALHWAGTETSTIWMGYMDGAARAGDRAALEAIDGLGQGARR